MDVKASVALTSDGRLQGSIGGSNTNLTQIRIKSIQCQKTSLSLGRRWMETENWVYFEKKSILSGYQFIFANIVYNAYVNFLLIPG